MPPRTRRINRNRPPRAHWRCPECGQSFKRHNIFLEHLRERHDLQDVPMYDPQVPEAAPPEDDGGGAEQAPDANPVAPAPVNHDLSGPPAGPYWDWDKGGDGYKARTALPDVAKMGLPKCCLDEYDAQMDFINTDCKAIVEPIDSSTALKPRELAAYEEEKFAFDERTCRPIKLYRLTCESVHWLR